MLEKKYIVSGIRDLEKQLPVIKEELSAYEYNDGVIAVYTGNLPEEELKDILRSLKENFPKLKITGMSSAVYANYYGKESVAVLGFVLMKEARAELFHREFDRDSESLSEELISYARELREKIRDMENVKSIELYFAWLKSSSSDFIRELSEGLEDIPVFGAISGVNSLAFVEGYTNTSNGDSIVIADETAAAGVSLVVYSGKDLYVYEDYLFGWKPVGRYLDVKTKNISSFSTTALTELDGEKATDVYDKYLGVKPNKYFVPNIGEFPLVIERNGIYIGRTPSGYGENGEVYLEGDILPGERVRFSYGEKEEILSRTVDGVNRMKGFGAERLALVICGNRFNFLQEDAHLEIDYYSEGRACEPVIILGMGEIYRYGGKGGVLNSALVAVGMREGLGEDLSSPVIHQKKLKEHKEIVPLAERLSHFLKAMTGELVEAVKDAKSASEAKSAFLSNMSHEIRTPINAVLGMDEIILREAEDKQILEYAHNIKMAGNTLLSLVNDILDFSKIEAGKMDII
ncbi:MAG: FIST C-terminal domain-containing protein, partial [Lachnospiraceae bacterium]|nr:FIST C-terminal domain-containing protein [Lachnospiraceae bacterium]